MPLPLTLVLDTGASQTMISPELARRAGMQVTRGAPLIAGNVVGGRRVSAPLVRARSLSVGAATVEDLDIVAALVADVHLATGPVHRDRGRPDQLTVALAVGGELVDVLLVDRTN